MKNPIRSLALIVLSLLSSLAVASAETYSWESQSSGAAASDDSLVVAKLPAKKVKVMITDNQPSSTNSPSSGFWWSAYSGMDIAVLGDISNNVVTTKEIFSPANSSTDHAGVLVGTELGYDLDKNDSLSLSFEKVWTSNQTFNGNDGPDRFYERFDPSLLGVSLNYSRVVDDHPGSRLSFTLGLGFYHTDMSADVNLSEFDNVFSGNFSGDILGGTLGIKEELTIAGDLGVEFTARGRIANFSQLTSKSLSVDGVNQTGGPFTLVNVGIPVGIAAVPTSLTVPPGYNHTQLDYSGFDGNAALVLHL